MLMSCLQIEIQISIQSIFNKNFSCNPVLMVILMVIYNYHLSHPIFSETDSRMLRVEANSPFRMQGYLQEMSYHSAIRSRCPWWKERKSCQEREGRVGGYSQRVQISVLIYCCSEGGFQDPSTNLLSCSGISSAMFLYNMQTTQRSRNKLGYTLTN